MCFNPSLGAQHIGWNQQDVQAVGFRDWISLLQGVVIRPAAWPKMNYCLRHSLPTPGFKPAILWASWPFLSKLHIGHKLFQAQDDMFNKLANEFVERLIACTSTPNDPCTKRISRLMWIEADIMRGGRYREECAGGSGEAVQRAVLHGSEDAEGEKGPRDHVLCRCVS